MPKNVSVSKLKPGDVCSENQYYTVTRVDKDIIHVKTDDGKEAGIGRSYVEDHFLSADQFTETREVRITEAASIFLSSAGVAMTVSFNKKVEEVDVINEIMGAYENSTQKGMAAAVKKAVKKALAGEERTMVGRHYGEPNEFGRVNFIDMHLTREPGKDYDTRTRQVDPRTINWFIVRGVRYTVKKK